MKYEDTSTCTALERDHRPEPSGVRRVEGARAAGSSGVRNSIAEAPPETNTLRLARRPGPFLQTVQWSIRDAMRHS
jgi:hypothetical protein